ncbi:MAG: tRNA uridine-5-carboxymethylaminomethyl(34) synthesis GTPase MnmE [Lentisphaerae bacterium]|nr:tRNA uridine-5-carboxymethylaminomethyl(34) synthesis GTPase MnmE [Lentisphaerota bacterium]
MNGQSDTIAAIATAPGAAGIAIIRISGPESLAVADRIFGCRGDPPSRRAARSLVHGNIKASDQIVDDVMLLIMRSPHSYTREDVVEIQCHGGHISAQRILETVLNQGVRMAEPGEFTKRAFLNGRIDLVQAEAVLDLIQAQSERSAQAAIEQLEGALSSSFNEIYDRALRACADLESSLDFSEDDEPLELVPGVVRELQVTKNMMKRMIQTWEEGHLLREGALVVISGRPNVGKSTLMNALLGKDRAIVSPIAGTTRDTIEETVILRGIPIRLVDTAGLRTTTCPIEDDGVRRAMHQMQMADLHLHILDSSKPLTSEDYATLGGLDKCRTLVIINKTDLGNAISLQDLTHNHVVYTQLITGKGVSDIRANIIDMLDISSNGPPRALISERHRQILTKSTDELEATIGILSSRHQDSIILATSQLRHCLNEMGQITGKVYHDELLNSIFSRFCIGK